MANTRYLTTEVENYVRSHLARKYRMQFSKMVLPLTVGGRHEFDAVAADLSIVASIKATSGLTSGGICHRESSTALLRSCTTSRSLQPRHAC